MPSRKAAGRKMHFLIVSFHSIRNDINVQTVYLKAYYKRKIYLQWDNWLLSSTPSYVDQQSNHLYEKGKDFNQFWVLKTKTKELISILTVLRQYYTSDTH